MLDLVRTNPLTPAVLVTLLLGAAVPLWCYPMLRRLGRFGVSDAAALAAHYGSISASWRPARPTSPPEATACRRPA